MKNRFRTLFQLRRQSPWDAAIIAQGHNPLKGGLLVRLIGAKTSAGENGNYTHRLDVLYGDHAAQRTSNIVRALGCSVDENDYRLILPSSTEGPKLKNNKISLAIHPGSHPNLSYKRWPVERFAEVVLQIKSQIEELQISIVGDSNEKELGDQLLTLLTKKGISSAANLAGNLSILETARLLSECRALLTNDSGIMHLSAAVGTPVCAVYAMTDSRWIGPLGKGHAIIRTGALNCSPCYHQGKIGCTERPCLFAVTPQKVAKSLLKILLNEEAHK